MRRTGQAEAWGDYVPVEGLDSGLDRFEAAHNAISDQFARRGTDKWSGIEWKLTRKQNPIIAGTLLWLDCNIVSEHLAGDGEVCAMSESTWDDGAPLLYFRGEYRHLHPSAKG